MKKIVFTLIFLMVATGAIWYTNRGSDDSGTSYRMVALEKGNLESVVSSTGNLGAVTTVQVGTQVSGIVDDIYVDFNDRVRKGQVIAKIDTTLLVTAIAESQSNLERARAQRDYSQAEYNRIKGLYDKKFTTEVELNRAKYDLETARASYNSAELNLERAARNLSYATIYSPIDGVVIERSVDVGQTVAASLSAPQLFLIANSLDKLQILTSVDESDIGRIENGMTARFTVQAHDDRVFYGIVRQVRLQSAVQENVVTYTVVVDVDNADRQLLPGMTATVDFLIETAENVRKVPNAALRFRPTEEMMAALRAQFQSGSGDSTRASGRAAGTPDSRPAGFSGQQGRGAGGSQGFAGGGRGGNGAMLWYLDEAGNPAVIRVRTGISDGTMTEVIGDNLTDGMQFIAGVSQGEDGGFTNPFENNQNQGGRRFGGF